MVDSAHDASPLAPFVPGLALELAKQPGSHHTSIDGSMLSADISGFTALSERLAAKGKAGAEEITDLVNQCFVELIESAYWYGGEVIKFGGDAILVLFRGDGHAARCADAALTMQTVLHATRAARRAKLSMSVGASHGPFDVFLAGSNLRELLIIGPAATQVVHLEGEAARGETLVSPTIAASLPADQVGREHAGGVAISGAATSPPGQPRDREWFDAEAFVPFVPTQVAEQFSAFADLGGEHRIVSVGFVAVTGLAELIEQQGADATAEALGGLVDQIIDRCARFGVTMLHTDIAPDGFKCLLCAGAPLNVGNSNDAMLEAALAIAAISSPFDVRQGVGGGRAFAGFLGSSFRRTYTLMGDCVNTSARLLGQAQAGDVVAIDTALEHTRTEFDVVALDPFPAKGKAELVHASRVVGTTSGSRTSDRHEQLVGRDAELDLIRRAVADGGRVIEVTGPAGVGKSRLLDAALQAMTPTDSSLRIFRGSCSPYGSASPYGVSRGVFRSGLGIGLDADHEQAGAELTAVVRSAAPDLVPMLPLIALPLDIAVAVTPEVDAIEPEFRRQRLHEVMVDFVSRLTDRPIAFVVEDMHWIDDVSGELISQLVSTTEANGWNVILTRRDAGAWKRDEGIDALTIPLTALSDSAVRSLVIDAALRPLSDIEVDAIVARAEGNPLFAIELARSIEASAVSELPDSVEQVIASRLDGLGPDVRHLVRIASVLGNAFSRTDLENVLEREAPGRSIDGPEFVEIISGAGPDRWAFSHALYRDVAYEGLPFAQRQHLHQVCGDTLENTSLRPDDQAALLSLHFSEAGDAERAWKYSVLAGRTAAEHQAFAEAAVALERAVLAGRSLRSVPRAERAQVGVDLGEAMSVLGRFSDARHALSSARRINDSVAVEADLMRRLGQVTEREGRLSVALSWYTRAESKIERDTADPAELIARSKILLAKAGIFHRRGDNHGCARLSHEALADAERAQDDATRSQAFARLHLAHVYTRSRYADLYGQSALEAFAELRDLNSQSSVLNHFGIQHYLAGNWTEASDFYARAAECGSTAGNVVFSGSAALNSGEILSDQGHWERAVVSYSDARRNFEAVGYPMGLAATDLFHGVALTRLGEFEAARVALTSALSELTRLTITELVDDAESRLIELDALAEPASVVERSAHILQRCERDAGSVPRLRRALAVAFWAVGDRDAARAHLATALGHSAQDSHERGLTVHALLELRYVDDGAVDDGAVDDDAADDDAADDEGWRAELAEISERLDIVRWPPAQALDVTLRR